MPSAAEIKSRDEPSWFVLRDTQFLADPVPQTYIHQRMIARDASALSRIGQLQLSFVPEWQKMRLHSLRILRGNEVIDKHDTAQIRFLQRELGLEQGIYTGAVSASIVIDDVRAGDVLDLEYSTIGRNPVFPDRFSDFASWDYPVSTDVRRVVVKSPVARKINAQFVGPDAKAFPVPTRRRDADHDVLIYTERDLAAARVTGLYPRDYMPLRMLQISEFKNWNEVATWAAHLFERSRTSPAVADVAKTLSGRDDSERVMAALRYVQREIRYFSVSLGESSHRPTSPDTTLQRRFGDCKDKTALTIALLDAMKIHADAVLVPAETQHSLSSNLPAPDLFDHVIVRVQLNGHDYYLDPTLPEQMEPLELAQSFHSGVDVLLTTANTTQPSRIALRKDETPLLAVTETVRITSYDAPLSLTEDVRASGSVADALRVSKRTTPIPDWNRGHARHMSERYAGAELTGDVQLIDDPAHNLFDIVATYTLPASTLVTKEKVHGIKYKPESILGHLSLPENDRKAPLLLAQLPARFRYELHVIAPPSVAEVRDPNNLSIGKPYFSLEKQSSFRGNEGHEIYELSIGDTIIPPDKLDDFRAQIHKFGELKAFVMFADASPAKAANQGFLSKVFGDGKKTQPPAAHDLVAERDAEAQASIERISRSLEHPQDLSDRDRAASLVARGNAYDETRQFDKATADFDEAVKIAPRSAEAHMERGTHLQMGEHHKEAIQEFSQAIALGVPTVDGSRRYRAVSEFFLGDFDDALEDARTSAANADPYGLLWYSMIAARSGKAVAADIVDLRKRNASGAWPRPMLALFDGETDVAGIEKYLESVNASERRLDSCEAYFYVGEYLLSRNDVEGARKYFQKSVDTDVHFYNEYQSARAELNRLSKH